MDGMGKIFAASAGAALLRGCFGAWSSYKKKRRLLPAETRNGVIWNDHTVLLLELTVFLLLYGGPIALLLFVAIFGYIPGLTALPWRAAG
jgi:hypothetical protein